MLQMEAFDSAWESLNQMVRLFPSLGTPLMQIAGSDVAGIKTTAIRQGNNYIVNGSKKWITNAIWADYVTAAVRTGGPGAAGVSVLIIPLKSSGVLTRKMYNSGVGASGSTFITFEDVVVPVENLIHKENRGFEVIMSNFNAERKSIATQAIRLSRVCAEDAWRHACTRETFGMKLIENPIIRAKFAKMGRMIEPAQAFLEQLTWLIELNRRSGKDDVRIGGMTGKCSSIPEFWINDAGSFNEWFPVDESCCTRK